MAGGCFMMSEKDLLARLLAELSRSIRALDDAEFAAALNGDVRLRVIVEPRVRVREDEMEQIDASATVTALRQLDALAAGMDLLEREHPSKEQLLRLCRFLDLRAEKRDTVHRLRERIVEATIGFRLRSEAIQNARP